VIELFRAQSGSNGDALLANVERFRSRDAVCAETHRPNETPADWPAPTTLSIGEYFERISRSILPQAANLASPFCMGHMTGPVPSFAPILAQVIASLNQNLVKRDASPGLTGLERSTIATLHRLVYREQDEYYRNHTQKFESTLGILGGGGTMANLTALWIARNRAFPPDGDFPGVERTGLCAALSRYGYDGAVIAGSELMHYSIAKTASVLGLGSNQVIRIPVDVRNRMDVGALEKCLASCLARRICVLAVVGNAGSTDCGSIDPLDEIGALAHAAGAFFHVDAAWGGPLLFSRACRPLLRGIESSDSVAFDAHKQMYLPVANTVLLFKDPSVARLIEQTSHYMLHDGSGDLGRRSLEGSRGGSVVHLDAALAIIGAAGYEYLIDENLRKARLMTEMIRADHRFELLLEPGINIVLYRYIPKPMRGRAFSAFSADDNLFLNRFNEDLQKAQSAAGRTYVSRTTLHNTIHGRETPILALRAVIANPLIEESHLRGVLEDQALMALELMNSKAMLTARPWTDAAREDNPGWATSAK
jgi:putative pyridoxal-dependent aspartate 1-decarboxylase